MGKKVAIHSPQTAVQISATAVILSYNDFNQNASIAERSFHKGDSRMAGALGSGIPGYFTI